MARQPVLGVLLATLILCTTARPQFPARLPNGNASLTAGSGITCAHLGHQSCQPPVNNQFGMDFKSAGYNWTTAFCQKDSDGDGLTNGEELGDPCCVWLSESGEPPARTTGLSHPGDADERATGNLTCMAERKEEANAVTPGTAGPACFPAGATVRTSRGSVRMDRLRLGDAVDVGKGKFSDVFLFTHADPDRVSRFVSLTTASGRRLLTSPGHLVYANGALVAVGSVRVGAFMLDTENKPDRVVSVSEVLARGLYNPHTLHGDIVVDGFRCSTYTTAVDPAPAAAALAPLRALFAWVGVSASLFDYGVPTPF